MRPADILARQADLIQRLGDPAFIRQFNQYSDDNLRKSGVKPHRDTTDYAQMLRGWLKVAETFRVDAHMNGAIQHHARAFDEHDPTRPYMPRSESGFLVFEEPISLDEVAGQEHLLHALAWMPVRLQGGDAREFKPEDIAPGERTIMFFGFNDLQRQPDEVYRRNQARMRNPLFGTSYGAEHMDAVRLMMGPWNQIIAFAAIPTWTMGAPRVVASPDIERHLISRGLQPAPEGASSIRRLVHAVWGLLDEVLPGAHREPSEPVERRPAVRRLKLKLQVELVTLRRLDERTENPGTGTPWSVRTIVKGHERTYHRGTEREFTRWIPEHEAGPAGAPWSMRRKVGNLKR